MTMGALVSPLADQSRGAGPELSMLPAGDVKPRGWIWKQMDLDLREGIPGNFPKISNFANHEIFANKNGTLALSYHYSNGKECRAWGVGEVEGNLLDGVVRLAFLTDNPEYKKLAKSKIEDILKAQNNEPEGYIGIYVLQDRFALRSEKKYNNGELWTQSRLFQGMLAYYEFTKDKDVLKAVQKAVDCSLAHYLGKEVFDQAHGVSHGIGFTDTLEWLYRLTGDEKYVAAMKWLYEDFSTKEGEKPPKATSEMSYDELKNPDTLWFSHTAHVAEALHAPSIAYKMTGEKKYKLAADNVLLKYDRHDTPGGGLPADERIEGRFGTSMLPGENCGNISTLMALNRIAVWTGDLAGTSRAENIALNKEQGARFHPALKALRYCPHDNQKDASDFTFAERYVYSALCGAAPCCSSSLGRLMPYYLEGIWFADHKKNELIANHYGPNRISTTLAGKRVSVIEETEFPFSDKIRFIFDADADATLVLRKPAYCGDIKVDARGARVEMSPHRVSLHGPWKKGDVVSVDFDFKPRLLSESNVQNAYYYRWGALLFALPLGEDCRKVKEIQAGDKPSGFFAWSIKALHPERWDYRVDPLETFAKVDLPGGNYETPYANPPVGLRGTMIDKDGTRVEVTLTPLGSSRLRRMSFPDYSRPIVGPQQEFLRRK